MQRLAASLILLFIASWGFAQVDLSKIKRNNIDHRNFAEISSIVIYSKDGNVSKYDGASFENEDSNIYVFTKSGNTLIFPHNNLDSLFSDQGTLSFSQAQQIAQRRVKKDPMIKKNSMDIMSMKGNLSAFQKMRDTGYTLQLIGMIVIIGGARNGNSKTSTIGGIVGLVGWAFLWKSGDLIDYNSVNEKKIRR